MPPRELFAGTLYMSYGQAYVMSAGGSSDALPVWGSKTNGLCGSAAPGSLWFVTASFDGDVFWRIVLADGPGNPDEWEEVVEGRSLRPGALSYCTRGAVKPSTRWSCPYSSTASGSVDEDWTGTGTVHSFGRSSSPTSTSCDCGRRLGRCPNAS